MSDPAVEADWRALTAMVDVCGDPGDMGPVLNGLSRDAAREALKPIRELHRPGPLLRLSTAWMEGAKQECRHCRRAWPCATARFAYQESELS